MGTVTAQPAAGPAAQAGDACAAGRTPRDHAPPVGQAGFKTDEADSGALTLIQRFGSAANLNIRLHCLVLETLLSSVLVSVAARPSHPTS